MKTIITYSAFILMMISLNSFGSDGFTGNLLFSAKLNGVQETPSVTTSGIGVASFSLNNTHDTMCINATIHGLSGPIILAHIHEGKVGVAGPIIIPLTTFVIGNKITATLTGINLTPAIISKFLTGSYYINVHTALNPNGEIRGQILLETDNQYSASMIGADETPAVNTNAQGLATFSLHQNDSVLSVVAIVNGLSGPIISAHLHLGAPGVPGPIVINLSSGIIGNMIKIDVNPSAILSDLLAGNIYMNVHTTANPNGEIRGQVMTDTKLNFDVFLDGASETPPTVSPAKGTGTVKVNSTIDTLWYDLLFDGISNPPTLAHFHEGAVGVAGPILINISNNILNDHRITGMLTGSDVTINFLNKMLEGNIYMNIHNALYPNGEIRGQVRRLVREGLTFEMSVDQETPPPSSSASMGSGLASIDRDKENIHFMIAVNDLTGPLNGAHFHKGAVGVPGPVIFEITQFFSKTSTNDTAFGFWINTDVIKFTDTIADNFFNNQMYVNVHTTAFPNGELRGQIMHGANCFLTPTAILENNLTEENLILFPNPTNDKLYLTFNANENENIKATILDTWGRQFIVSNANVTKGENKILIDVDQFSAGIYNLQINISNKKLMNSKFIKQ